MRDPLRGKNVRHVCPKGKKGPVGQIDHFHDPEDQREPGGDEGIGRPGENPVQEDLREGMHGNLSYGFGGGEGRQRARGMPSAPILHESGSTIRAPPGSHRITVPCSSGVPQTAWWEASNR